MSRNKKFETTMNRLGRFEEELKHGCTTEKGVVRRLTNEEIEYRKGFCETVRNAVLIKSGSQEGVLDPLYENRMSGVSSAFAFMRGEKKHHKKMQEKKTFERLNKKYGVKTSQSTNQQQNKNKN